MSDRSGSPNFNPSSTKRNTKMVEASTRMGDPFRKSNKVQVQKSVSSRRSDKFKFKLLIKSSRADRRSSDKKIVEASTRMGDLFQKSSKVQVQNVQVH